MKMEFIERSLPVVSDQRLIPPEKLMVQICAQLPPPVLLSSFSPNFFTLFSLFHGFYYLMFYNEEHM